jgi:hypothetical protein
VRPIVQGFARKHAKNGQNPYHFAWGSLYEYVRVCKKENPTHNYKMTLASQIGISRRKIVDL